ncbi:Protein mlp1 [Lecanora helva]
MAAAELDLTQLSSYCSLPKQSFDALLDTPTVELVRDLLKSIIAKANEHNELSSEKLKLRVELENAVRGGETKTRVLKSAVEKGTKEAAELRERLQEEENKKASVETELENLKTSTAESSSELSTQKVRISALESSNRDTLSLLESKTTAFDKLAEELNAQHQKTVDLRREVSRLEQSVQSADNASTNAKFHEQGLQQEIESLKRNNDWLDNELKTKAAEHAKNRKEKGLRIAELQRQNEELQNTIDAANRTETNLRRRLDELSQKADESFLKVQVLEEQAAKRDEAFRVELDAANRLTELTRNSANTERERQQDLAMQLETAREDAREQNATLNAMAETEHRAREAADATIAELEVKIEELQTALSASQVRRSTENAHEGVNGYTTPTHGTATPLASPGVGRLKGRLSLTQVYSGYNDLKGELDFEKRRSEKLSNALDEMVQDLESRQPEIEELRSDHSRLESEVAEMSSLVDIVGKERDNAVKAAKKWEGQIEAKAREGEVLRQQLRDLSCQVKVFLMEVHLRDQGHHDLSAEARAQLERVALGQIDKESTEGMTDTDRFISENLVTFRNISELQEQNNSLLKITRELGEKMEQEEATRKQLQETQNWDELQQKYERCKDEVKALVTQSQSYIRERDMFRRMLTHRGQLPVGADTSSLFGESINMETATDTPGQSKVMNSVEGSPSSKDLADYARLYKEMLAHFDAYRNEAATDHSTLKKQVDSLSKLNGEFRSEVVRSNSQVTLAHERYEMLQANYAMLRSENTELQRRSQQLSDGAAKQELRVQQVAEDLIEARGLVDSMRNETANLKAEKDFWKSVEKRLTEDNENLLNERNRLNGLNTNLQNLLNERERSDNEARRRLQNQADHLEKDLQATKDKLAEEVEENKRNVQRREYDNEQSRKRIDDLVSSLSSIREQLVAANTTKDHLSSRVEELTIELRSSEERANVLQKAPTPRPRDSDHDAQEDGVETPEASLSKEQQLAVQVSELRHDLDLMRADLESAKAQVEQYKAISQASEDELQSLNETQDMYRQETDKLIAEKDLKIKELEQRVEDTASELSSTSSELSNLRDEQVENGRRLEDHKKAFEAELAQVKDQDDRHAAAAQYYQEDLKAQAAIAQQAQQNYENELVKHADAAKALQKTRADYNDLKLEIVGVKTEAESARTSLSQNEESWAESRDRYERELAELRAGRENLKAQNDRLHQQLESVTSQITDLRKRADSGEEIPNEEPQAGLDNLQEVIRYLRREKEIVDVQLELSMQEGKRLKQQLDYSQSQLDDTRLRLNQQRHIEADNERTSLDHNKLVETINELNTFRESSVTLRAESRQAQAALAARIVEVDELKAQVEPLQAEIQDLKNERETQEGEMKLLKENSDRWQQRAQNVLQKYDRVDPAELEALKEQIKTLEAERDELATAKQTLQAQAHASSAQVSQVQEQSNEKLDALKARLTDQFKARSKSQTDKIKEKDAALQTATNEKQRLEQQLSDLSGIQTEVETMRAERDAAIEKADAQNTANLHNGHNGSEDGQVNEGESSRPTHAEVQSLERRANEEASRAAGLQEQSDNSKARVTELELQVKALQESIDSLKAELSAAREAHGETDNISSIEAEQQIAQLRNDLAQAKQEVDNLRADASVNSSLADAPAEDGSKPISVQVAEHVQAVRAELEARHSARIKETEDLLEKRTNNMKTQLSKKLTEGKNQIRQTLLAEHEENVIQLKAEHDQAMEKLKTRHQDEMEELRTNENLKLTKLQEERGKERQTIQNGGGSSGTKAEAETSPTSWQPSEAEARAFIQSNEVARSIMKKNIIAQVNKTRDELTAQLKEEHGKAMTESQNKANTAKEHAVMMEGKKTALQVNMANNKCRIAQHKNGLVEKAAQETPEKAVAEVWSAVKDAKPPPVVAPQAQQAPPKAQQAPEAANSAAPTPSAQNGITSQPNSAPMGLAQNSPFGQLNASSQEQQTKPANPLAPQPNVTTFGRPSPAAFPTQAQSPGAQDTSTRQDFAQSQGPPNAPGNDNNSTANQNSSPIQQRPFQNPINQQLNAGTGPGALRNLQQSGLPIARGGSMRGNPAQRGRGSGIARGGPQGINTNQAQRQGTNSPTGSGMNPGAKQFVPGNKRPRDDEYQGGDAGNGKRIRGGGASRGRGGIA